MQRSFTESGRRALKRAASLARRDASDAVEPLHLLWALILEESRAAELLQRHGIARAAIPDALCGDQPDIEDTTDEPPALSVDMTGVIAEARARVRRAPGGEINTEHLLWGLTAVQTPASELLAAHGLRGDAIPGGDSGDPQGEPLPVDFEIAWESKQAPGEEARLLNPQFDVDAGSESQIGQCRSSPEKAGLLRGDVWRTLDAAANRAREGLRVVEDFTRFHLNDGHLSRLLKECRHALQFPDDAKFAGIAMRDTPGDVGTGISTPSEAARQSPADVAAANLKRVQEAVRSLEEFGKCIAPEFAARCEAIRYRLYTLEKAILTTAAARQRLEGRRLYLLLTRDLCRQDPQTVLREAVASGVDVIQIREKSLPDRELLRWCRRIKQILTETPNPQSPLLIVNDRPDIAVLCDADGVHVGQDELSAAEARRIVGPERLVGVSTHSIDQARQAVLDGADYLGVGPVFASQTKSFEHFAGLEFVREAAVEIALPWFAIGGIDARNLPQVKDAGATRVAVSGAICQADDVADATAELRAQLA